MQGDGGCGEGASAQPHTRGQDPPPPGPLPTREQVLVVLAQLLGLRVEAAGAAAGGGRQPLAQGLERRAALWGAEDHDGVILHVVEAVHCRGRHVQERVLVLGPARGGVGGCGRERNTQRQQQTSQKAGERSEDQRWRRRVEVKVGPGLAAGRGCDGPGPPPPRLSLSSRHITAPPGGAAWVGREQVGGLGLGFPTLEMGHRAGPCLPSPRSRARCPA